MKKVFFLVVATAVCSFYACETENVEEPQSVVELNESNDLALNAQEESTSRYRNCIYIINGCSFINSGIFEIRQLRCDIEAICEPYIKDPCEIFCLPKIYDLNILLKKLGGIDLIPIKDELKLDIDPRITTIPFPINKKFMGLQAYKEAGSLKKDVFRVKKTLVLDTEMAKTLGLQGNVIRAGEYPVVVDDKNGTYNAIVSVEKGFK